MSFPDPREEAARYLHENNLYRLFDILGARLAYFKPEDPNAFLVAELNRIKNAKEAGQPVTLFNEQDIAAMFLAFDITNRGYLSRTQYRKALNACGINSPALKEPDNDTIDKTTFVEYVYAEVLQHAYR